jgi:hypothetical protein
MRAPHSCRRSRHAKSPPLLLFFTMPTQEARDVAIIQLGDGDVGKGRYAVTGVPVRAAQLQGDASGAQHSLEDDFLWFEV